MTPSSTHPGLQTLLDALHGMTTFPERSAVADPFLFSVDHCFNIRGQGTVMTGTVLQGVVKVNDVSYRHSPSFIAYREIFCPLEEQ